MSDLETMWKEAEARLASVEVAVRRPVAAVRAASQLRRVAVVVWYEAVASAVVVALTGSYLGGVAGVARLAVPAVLLHGAAILVLAGALRQVVALRAVDIAGPVLPVQARLAELALWRARSNRWLILSAPLLWALLVVVVLHALLGLDVARVTGAAWVAANFTLGVAVLATAAWLSRRAPEHGLLRALGDDVTGRRVAAASAAVGEIGGFTVD